MRVLYCAGEQARVVLDILERRGEDEDVIVLDDDPARHGERVAEVDVVGGRTVLDGLDPSQDRVLVSFGAKQGVRLELAQRVRACGIGFFNALDADATISSSATVGEGVTVNARTYVGPGARIGDHALVDSAVAVSHDAVLADGVTVGPNATLAGGVSVGRDAFVGAGATVRDHVEVGERATVGAGAVVVDNVQSDTTVVGVPAKPLDRADDR